MRRALRWTLISIPSVLVALVVLLVLLAWFGVPVNAGLWRGQIAQAASEALGREIRLEGPLEMVVSVRPSLKVGGIRIMNPPGFSTPFFASLGDARLKLDLLELWRKRLRVRELTAENVAVHLEKVADGKANWVFQLALSTPAAPAAQPEQPRELSARDVTLEIITLGLKHLDIDLVRAGDPRTRYFALDELNGEGGAGKPIKLALRGSVEKTFPYQINFTSGPLSEVTRLDRPWPFELTVDFLGTVLRASGSVNRTGESIAGEMLFGMGTDNLREVERLLQTELPKVGATALAGRLSWSGGQARLEQLRGLMGATTLDGELTFDTTGERPKLSGRLALPSLDLRPFLVGAGEKEPEEAPRSLADTYRELEQQTFALSQLKAMDADLTLAVGQWLSLPGDVRDAQLGIKLENGVLRAPVQGSITGVALSGALEVDGAAAVPSFALTLGAQKSTLGGLAELLAGVHGVQGNMDRFALRLGAKGASVGELVRALDVRLELANGRLSYGNVEGGTPVQFTLDRLTVELPGGRPLVARARGALLGQELGLQIRGGDLPTMIREQRSPLEVTGSGSGATVRVAGVLAAPTADAGTDLDILLQSRRAGDLGRWIGLSASAAAPFLLSAHARARSDEWSLRDLRLRLGNTEIVGELRRIGIGALPLIKVLLDARNIDVKELEAMLPPPKPRLAAPAASQRAMVDIPILPAGIDLTDADVEVKLRRVDMEPLDVTDASFYGRIREGQMLPSPFFARFAETSFQGAVALDLRAQVPAASLWLAANEVDIGRLLSQLKIIEQLDARADSLRFQLLARGQRLGEMLRRSELEANLDDGRLVLRGLVAGGAIGIGVTRGVVRAGLGEPVSVTLDGAVDSTPVAIKVASAPLQEFLDPSAPVPFAVSAEAAGARLDLSGKVQLPVTRREGEVQLGIRGQRLDTLNTLARASLPPWGPYALEGAMRVSNRGYEVPNLSVRMGESRLDGSGSLTEAGGKPRIDVALRAPNVQLNDFSLKGWSAFDKPKPQDSKPMSVEEMRAKAKEAAAEGQKLLSAEVLRRQDAFLTVDVDQVVSGADKLGSGSLKAKLENGRLAVEPLEVNVPGGGARIWLAYTPSETDVAMEAKVRVDRFDYGVLARRLKPEMDLKYVQGLFSLHLDLQSRAPTIDALMSRGNGRLDFAVWPKDLRAGIFDLWAVNLFLALIPAVDPASESKVNCALGRFDLKDGILTHQAILMDTSRMRVSGQGRVDFPEERLLFKLAPQAKTAQFFSLSTPVQVTGSFTNFKVGLAPGALAETTVRLLTSVFVVPIQKLSQGSMPRDGADVCTAALRPGDER
jgi:uncharacterized protein involved in outer membrane biogenesis